MTLSTRIKAAVEAFFEDLPRLKLGEPGVCCSKCRRIVPRAALDGLRDHYCPCGWSSVTRDQLKRVSSR